MVPMVSQPGSETAFTRRGECTSDRRLQATVLRHDYWLSQTMARVGLPNYVDVVETDNHKRWDAYITDNECSGNSIPTSIPPALQLTVSCAALAFPT